MWLAGCALFRLYVVTFSDFFLNFVTPSSYQVILRMWSCEQASFLYRRCCCMKWTSSLWGPWGQRMRTLWNWMCAHARLDFHDWTYTNTNPVAEEKERKSKGWNKLWEHVVIFCFKLERLEMLRVSLLYMPLLPRMQWCSAVNTAMLFLPLSVAVVLKAN